jgi:hypothetical protein
MSSSLAVIACKYPFKSSICNPCLHFADRSYWAFDTEDEHEDEYEGRQTFCFIRVAVLVFDNEIFKKG